MITLRPEHDPKLIEHVGSGGGHRDFRFTLVDGRAQKSLLGVFQLLLAQKHVVVGGTPGVKAGAFGVEILFGEFHFAPAELAELIGGAGAAGRAEHEIAQL